jgi:predicted metalloendopeptidase
MMVMVNDFPDSVIAKNYRQKVMKKLQKFNNIVGLFLIWEKYFKYLMKSLEILSNVQAIRANFLLSGVHFSEIGKKLVFKKSINMRTTLSKPRKNFSKV